ncbi:EF-hand domain-containing protein [Sphingobium bisphenolivorans]|uniref:EF-hand domain-containing protein n=1 Tax=Sphingobium bisphenolivorans TaxID=1335760 RepID=UPI0003A2E287|nr:EF-hand domain-containing protein [Sphingobium bisphenolivorans]
MIRALLCTAALGLTAPAVAQTAATPGQSPPAEAQKPAATGDAVASIVESEFPAYDQNNDGQLDKAEFSRWMVALKGQEMKAAGTTLAPAEVSAWADGAFATADADKSVSVSKPELITYLSGGAV